MLGKQTEEFTAFPVRPRKRMLGLVLAYRLVATPVVLLADTTS